MSMHTAACAHVQITRQRVDREDGSVYNEWRCHDCRLDFWPSYEVKRLRRVLFSIAKNTCCETCHEAALIAQQALNVD